MRFIEMCVCALVVLGAMIVSPAAAQPSATEVGVKAGVNFATVTSFAEALGDEGLDTSRRAGILFGGYVSLPWLPNVFVQPEVLLVQKGIKISGGVLNVPVDAAVKLTYLEIPVLIQYRFSARTTTPYVFAGPAIGFNTSAHVSSSVFGLSGDSDEDVSDEVRNLETSVVLGAGAMGDWWLAEFRLSQGLSAVNEGGASDFGRDVRNRAFAGVFGVRF